VSPTWFEALFGFREAAYPITQGHFALSGSRLVSRVNRREFDVGTFTTPTLGELRERTSGKRPGALRVRHLVIGDVLELHAQPENAGALFQVASQFNCLEFVGPHVTPESGITGYADDQTQGPACALAAAAATVYRNYFAPVNGIPGQTEKRQLDNLDGLAERLGAAGNFFEVRNGYTDSDAERLSALAAALRSHEREDLLGLVKIGLQQRVQVTYRARFLELDRPAFVSQAFCSAVSCGYSRVAPESWEPLATLALDAAYEATLLAAVLDADEAQGSGIVWLTLLGAGAFRNPKPWIVAAIGRALRRCAGLDLDVRVAHFGRLDRDMQAAIELASERAA